MSIAQSLSRTLAALVRVSIVAAFCAAMAACRDDVPLYEYQPVDTDGWGATDTLSFHLDAPETDTRYILSLGIRATERVDYRDLWLVLEQRTDIRRRDTLHLILASDQAHWQTRGALLHELEEQVCETELPAGQPLDILVYHVMRRQDIAGLTEVGVKATVVY